MLGHDLPYLVNDHVFTIWQSIEPHRILAVSSATPALPRPTPTDNRLVGQLLLTTQGRRKETVAVHEAVRATQRLRITASTYITAEMSAGLLAR